MYFRIVKDGAGKIIEWEAFRRKPLHEVKGALVEIKDLRIIEELQFPVDENGTERLSFDDAKKEIRVDIPLTDAIKRSAS